MASPTSVICRAQLRRWSRLEFDIPNLTARGVGTCCSFLSTPFELVKVQLQLDTRKSRHYTGSAQCALYLLRTHGVSSLYRGFVVNTAREATFCSVYFGSYEIGKKLVTQYTGPAIGIPLAGGTSGMFAWFASFPLDVIKANIQAQDPSTPRNERLQIRKVVISRWREAGLSGFYWGFGPSMLRAFLVSGSRFSVYEMTYSLLHRLEEHFLQKSI